MNQLLDLQKASIQKGVTFSPESQKNLQNVTDLYLDYQKQFQDLNSSITKDNLEAQQLQNKIKEVNDKLVKQNEQAEKEYNELWVKHNWAMAGLQLIILIPLLLVSALLYRKYKTTIYRAMILAVGIAVFLKISIVMHQYFPSYLFNYLLILILIALTIQTLISMLRMVNSPKPAWLQKQYQEAYQKAQCPECQFSIKPSVSKLFYPDAKGNLPVANYSYLETVDKYTCPSCGVLLFEKCSDCSHLRHSLLGYCDNCGAKKDFAYTLSNKANRDS